MSLHCIWLSYTINSPAWLSEVTPRGLYGPVVEEGSGNIKQCLSVALTTTIQLRRDSQQYIYLRKGNYVWPVEKRGWSCPLFNALILCEDRIPHNFCCFIIITVHSNQVVTREVTSRSTEDVRHRFKGVPPCVYTCSLTLYSPYLSLSRQDPNLVPLICLVEIS